MAGFFMGGPAVVVNFDKETGLLIQGQFQALDFDDLLHLSQTLSPNPL